jgi:hypothetical protein
LKPFCFLSSSWERLLCWEVIVKTKQMWKNDRHAKMKGVKDGYWSWRILRMHVFVLSVLQSQISSVSSIGRFENLSLVFTSSVNFFISAFLD